MKEPIFENFLKLNDILQIFILAKFGILLLLFFDDKFDADCHIKCFEFASIDLIDWCIYAFKYSIRERLWWD